MNDKEFIRAVNGNQIEKVREMLPTISSELLNMMHDSRTQEGNMAAIHVAAAKGHIEILKLLINDSRIDINLKTSGHKFNPLQLAALNGNLEACALLLPLNDVLNPDSKRAYFLATQEMNKPENTKKNIQYKRIADLLRIPTFIKACEIGNLEIIKMMVKEGAVDINARIEDDWGLKAAWENGHITVADYLLSLPQIDITMTTSNGDTLLHLLSARKSHISQLLPLQDCSFSTPSVRFRLIEKLIKRGADVNAKNAEGDTPLYYATASNLLDAVKALVSNGADLTIQYKRDTTMGFTPEEFENTKKRTRQLIESHKHLYIKFASLLKGEDDLDVKLEEISRDTTEVDIFSIAENHPEILDYLEGARKYGGGELGFMRAGNEKLRTLVFEHRKNREEKSYRSLPPEPDQTMSPKPF